MPVRLTSAPMLAVLIAGAFVAPAAAADAEHGKVLFQACVACHNDDPNALGPNLHGVVGRKAAAREDFRYSNAMTRANLTWDEANLKSYLADTQAKIKGNRMPFGGVADPKDIDDLIAYLQTYK